MEPEIDQQEPMEVTGKPDDMIESPTIPSSPQGGTRSPIASPLTINTDILEGEPTSQHPNSMEHQPISMVHHSTPMVHHPDNPSTTHQTLLEGLPPPLQSIPVADQPIAAPTTSHRNLQEGIPPPLQTGNFEGISSAPKPTPQEKPPLEDLHRPTKPKETTSYQQRLSTYNTNDASTSDTSDGQYTSRMPQVSDLGLSETDEGSSTGELVIDTGTEMPILTKAKVFSPDDNVVDCEMPCLEKIDQNPSNQCTKLSNPVDSYNNPRSPSPVRTFPLTLIDLSTGSNTRKAHLKRKLWMQNLLQLRDSLGEGLIFLNGKVIWKENISPSETATKQPLSGTASLNSKSQDDNPDYKTLPSPMSQETPPTIPSTPTELTRCVETSASSTSDTTETNISIKIPHKEFKLTDPRSSNRTNWQDRQNVKRKLATTDLNSSTDSTDPNRSKNSIDSISFIDSPESSTSKKDSRHYMYKSSKPITLKKKPAADYFDTDLDTSNSHSDLDSSFSMENANQKQTVERVSAGVKKLKIEESSSSKCKPLLLPEEEEDVQYQFMLLNMEENSDHVRHNKISSRKCRVCGEVDRNLKRHTIYEHLSDVWWGVLGDATCWKCQAYHSLPDIRHCDGYYVAQRDFRSLIMRHNEFFSYIRDDLECSTDSDLIDIVIREGLCQLSVSPFTSVEIGFMRDIDRAKGLSTDYIYTAQKPMRVTELLHWRTLGEIFNYVNIRGCISSEAISMKPIRFVDCFCNVIELYNVFHYKGPLAALPVLTHAPAFPYLHKVVTDITDPSVFFSQWSHLLFNDCDIKISMGLQPNLANNCSSIYLKQVEKLMTDSSVVALGGVGIDARLKDTLEIQISVFTSFLKIAARHFRTLRLVCMGAHTTCMNLLKTNLVKTHMIHYLNFNGSVTEADEFMKEFPNGFFGISKESCTTNPYARSLVKQIPLDRLAPGSNAPFSTDRRIVTLPTDIGEIICLVARIKGLPIQTVAKQFRYSTTLLYGV